MLKKYHFLVSGDVIRILKREPNGVDDGWWYGEIRRSSGSSSGGEAPTGGSSHRGLFPSIVVEECAAGMGESAR